MKSSDMQLYQLLHDFLTDYLPTYRNLSDKTVRAYRLSLKLMARYLCDEEGIRFDALDFSHFSRLYVYKFLAWLRDIRNCSAQTLNLRLSAIKSFLKYCAEENFELTVFYLDVSGIRTFKDHKNPVAKHLTQPQLKRLFATPDITTRLGRRDRFFLILAYETGARMQELLDLEYCSIMRDGQFVKIRICGKGAKVRYVPLMESTAKHLDAYLAEFHASPDPHDYLFYTVHDSKHTQMKSGTVDYLMKKYGRLAHAEDNGFPSRLHVHMLRHSIAMTMYKKGIPISYIKDFLGHSSIDTTSVYSHADEEVIAQALASIDHSPSKACKAVPVKEWKDKEQYLRDFCGMN